MKVHFRKFPNGEIIALFPEEMADMKGNIMSYQHIGQHSGASPELINELDKATVKEYFDLCFELQNDVGYTFLQVQS